MTSIQHLALACTVVWMFATSASGEQTPAALRRDIPPQPLPQALAAFALQTGLQLIYVSNIVRDQQSPGARADSQAAAALEQLLTGTGLRFEFLNSRTVKLFAPANARPTVAPLVAAPAHRPARSAALPAAQEEIVVTATRREGFASQAPLSMTVWSQQDMEASGIKGMAGIGALTPGVEFDFNTGISADFFTNLVIRGVALRHGNTTGIFIDDTQMYAAQAGTFGRAFPWSFDLERIEVLRGPQGTLLGQGTLGGAIRFILKQPNLRSASGYVRTEWSTTERGAANYEAGAAWGGPLISDVLAVRVSAWTRSEGGFVDHVDRLTGAVIEHNTNTSLGKSARAALTWQPMDAVQIAPSLVYESFDQRNPSTFFLSDSGAGELRNTSVVNQPAYDNFHLASLRFAARMRSADLSAVTSYTERAAGITVDINPAAADYTEGAALPITLQQTVFSQELRLSSADPGATLSWITGIHYSAVRYRQASSVVSFGTPVIEQTATVIDQNQREAYAQFALRLSKHITASAGWRFGRTTSDGATETPPISKLSGAETAVTPSYGLSYQTDASNLLYLTVAKGYRSGGVVPGCGTDLDRYLPDTIWNYEIGAKSRLLAGRVQLDANLFHGRLDNVQQDAITTTCVSSSPGATATTSGFELALRWMATHQFTLSLGAAYADAHFTQTVKSGDAVVVRSGDALGQPPLMPSPWTATASVDYNLALWSGVSANLRVEDAYRSRNPGPLYTDSPTSPEYNPDFKADPATNILNLRAQLQWPGLELTLLVDNALDSQPILGRRGTYVTTFRPRTVGLSATVRF